MVNWTADVWAFGKVRLCYALTSIDMIEEAVKWVRKAIKEECFYKVAVKKGGK